MKSSAPEQVRVVWHAMSELFLDTELGEREFAFIAGQLRQSGLAKDELDRVFWEDVFPALIPNLWSVAGVWSGFKEESVEELVLARRAKKWKLPLWLVPGRSLVRKEWDAVRRLI